jgi:hypothetical protein
MKLLLTNREFIEEVIKYNPKYKDYIPDDYLNFIKNSVSHSKKTRSNTIFELSKNEENLEFNGKCIPERLTDNEFLSNKILINHKNPFVLLFLKQMLDYYFIGKINSDNEEMLRELHFNNDNDHNNNNDIHLSNWNNFEENNVIEFENPITIKELLNNYYKISPNMFNNIKLIKNNRIKINMSKFKTLYDSPGDIPFDNFIYKYNPQIGQIILNIKVYNNKGIKKLYSYLNEIGYGYHSYNLKRIKTKYKRTNIKDYDFKEKYFNIMENHIPANKSKEPLWGYIHSFFSTSLHNRERKKRYYIDNEDKYLKKPHRNFLRYKKKYRTKTTNKKPSISSQDVEKKRSLQEFINRRDAKFKNKIRLINKFDLS